MLRAAKVGGHRGFGSITGACSGSVADQQHDEVGHLFGLGEPPRHRAGGGLFGDIPGFAASGPGDRRGDAVLTNPQQGGDRPRTDRADADASRASNTRAFTYLTLPPVLPLAFYSSTLVVEGAFSEGRGLQATQRPRVRLVRWLVLQVSHVELVPDELHRL